MELCITAQYRVFEEVREIEYCGTKTTYGILAVNPEDGTQLLRVPDVTTEKSLAEKIAAFCTREAVSPIHFFDVLEDFWGSDEF